MAVETNQVFLVQGQRVVQGPAGARVTSPVIEQVVAVAVNAQAAHALVVGDMPDFMPLGFTSLEQFEDAVLKLRSAISGGECDWPLLVAPGMI